MCFVVIEHRIKKRRISVGKKLMFSRFYPLITSCVIIVHAERGINDYTIMSSKEHFIIHLFHYFDFFRNTRNDDDSKLYTITKLYIL